MRAVPSWMLIGAAVATQSVQLLDFRLDLAAMLAVVAISVIGARRVPRLRRLSGGVALGIALLLVVIALIVIRQFV